MTEYELMAETELAEGSSRIVSVNDIEIGTLLVRLNRNVFGTATRVARCSDQSGPPLGAVRRGPCSLTTARRFSKCRIRSGPAVRNIA